MQKIASLLLFLSALVFASNSFATNVITISKAQIIDLDRPNDLKIIDLPSLSLRTPRTFKRFKLVAEFSIEDTQAAALWAVYFVSLYDGGRISINGISAGDVPTSTPAVTVRHARPFNFQIPPNMLRNGKNRLEVVWGARETLTLVSRIFVGPMESISPDYQQRLFWQNDMAQAALVYALVIGVMLLGIFLLRRDQRSYLLLGLSAFGCAIVVFVYSLPALPYWLYPYWRFIHLAGIALFTQCAWLFLITQGQPTNRWFPKFCVFWGVLGPTVYLINFWLYDDSFFRSFEGFWGVICGAMGLYPVAILAFSVARQFSWRKLIFLMATLLAIFVGIMDVSLQSSGKSGFGNFGYSLQVVSSAWLTALTSVLVTDFIGSLSEQDAQQQVMTQKLNQQQIELSHLYKNSRQNERDKATMEERQRIMQDMHDGLGSQLVSSLALSERGALTANQINFLLRECIDDLRLAIDTVEGNNDQFSVAAGNLRFRMEPRLRAAGITLAWDSTAFSDDTVVPSTQTLPLLRIMQETISNSLKHAQASRISVRVQASNERLIIAIHDNGKGFDIAGVRLGKGISGIEKRARGLGASLSIVNDSGTRMTLILPLTLPPSGYS
jgi:signal transduction histidine kinase